jgi:two-component system response regulator LytT
MKLKSQLLFWVIVFVLMVLFFGQKWSSTLHAFYFTSLLMPVSVGTVYFFNAFLVPKYLFTKQYFRFTLYTIYTITVSMCLSAYTVVFAFIYLANYSVSKMNPMVFDVISLGLILYFVVFSYSFIVLTRKNLDTQDQILEFENQLKRNKKKYLEIRSDRKVIPLDLRDLMIVESMADYVQIHTASNKFMTKEKISKILVRLPDNFIRVHRSFIVNSDKIDSFNKEIINIQDQEIPISRKYKADTLAYLSKLAADTPR